MNNNSQKFSARPNLLRTYAPLTSITQRFSDISCQFLAIILACHLLNLPFSINYLVTFLISIIIFEMLCEMTDFYRSWRGIHIITELYAMVLNWTLSLVLSVFIFSFFFKTRDSLRLYLFWCILSCLGLILGRIIIRSILSFLRQKGFNTRNVVLMGTLPVGMKLAQSFKEANWTGLKVLGFYDNQHKIDQNEFLIPYLGTLDQMVKDSKSGKIDRIYIAMPMKEEELIHKTISELEDTTCSVLLIPDIFTFVLLRSYNEEINGIPVISVFDTPMSGLNRIMKRTEDIALSFLILLVISPLFLLIMAAIKITSPGHIFFKQTRYGMEGKPFRVWKFRTMSVLENGQDIAQARKHDPRVTSLGRLLRKTSLDELPQFLNVLAGNMSIVGPRPHAIAHNEHYRRVIKGYMLRHKMKPGITGWAQINGWRGETNTLEKMQNRVEYDLEYIRNWSLGFDLKIIVISLFKGFVSKSSY